MTDAEDSNLRPAGQISDRQLPLSELGMSPDEGLLLNLCHREIDFGGQNIRQFWIPKPGLYGTRNRQSGNRVTVLDFFRYLCLHDGEHESREPAETHLLASLLPNTRSTGAQRVVSDASLRKSQRATVDDDDAVDNSLEGLLARSADKRLNSQEFDLKNRGAVGFPQYSEETFARYRELESRLLGEAVNIWWRDPAEALSMAHSHWTDYQRSFGRRAGHELEKDVLDILSFESKAAFHQCYSALWFELIPCLAAEQPDASLFTPFHGFWHLEHRPETRPQPTHLFHGLVLGLHPAFGSMLKTNSGLRLVAEFVANPSDPAAKERFLHGSLVSLHHYAGIRDRRSPN